MAVLTLSTIGSIATFINENLGLTSAISGNMIEIVDMARQHVANYTGDTIGSNSISAKYAPAIVDFASADAIDLKQAQSGGENVRLGELSIDDSGDTMNAKQFRMMGDMKLKRLGKKVQFARSLS